MSIRFSALLVCFVSVVASPAVVSEDNPSSFQSREHVEFISKARFRQLLETSSISAIENLQMKEGVLAFPGAVGYGKNAKGGRGGRALVVNTLENVVDPNDSYLSLREAIEEESGPRTIVFNVGGVFDVGEQPLNLLGEEGSFVTLACQSAPVPGVTIKTYGFNVQHGAHDIVFRHCAIRGIDTGNSSSQAGRAMTIRGGSYNIVLDHMSLSWATDELFQAYLGSDQNTGLSNITLSNSIISEGDADSSHPESVEHAEWGYHSMGPSCLNNNRKFQPSLCSFVNNFVAHNSSRNVMIWGGTGEMSNNIVYNWYSLGMTARPYANNDVEAIVKNNLLKTGPDTEGATSNPICGPSKYRCALALGVTDQNGTARYTVDENYFVSHRDPLGTPELMDIPNARSSERAPSIVPATSSDLSILLMAQRGSRHTACLGASRPMRDQIDARVLEEFFSSTGHVGIGENDRRAGHNVTIQRTWDVLGSPSQHDPYHDSDQDGMPDNWERQYGLNPTDASDTNGDLDGDGYTNLEEYLAVMAHCSE